MGTTRTGESVGTGSFPFLKARIAYGSQTKTHEVHAEVGLVSYVRTFSALKRQQSWMVGRGRTVCKVSYSLEILSQHTRVGVSLSTLKISGDAMRRMWRRRDCCVSPICEAVGL